MEIIKKGNRDRRYRYKCDLCGCIFDLTAEDRAHNVGLFYFQGCPSCGNFVDLKKPLKVLEDKDEKQV